MNEHLLRAPTADGALLSVPPLADVSPLLTANADRLAAWDYDFQGRPASRLRQDVRRQILKASRSYLKGIGLAAPDVESVPRLIVTGHQPELFHPGVWVKNFAISHLARETGALALNLIVDNDIPKSSALKVPKPRAGTLKVERVLVDDWAGEIPYEDLKVEDESLFASFPERVREVLGGAIADPVLDEFWPRAMASKAFTDTIGYRFSAARRSLEDAWGIHNLEVPLSTVCESEAFQWFACHLFAHLPRFQEVHNEALARYRDQYKIRSTHHPVPALGNQGEWLEAPFWVWRKNKPRRKPLLVRQNAKSLDLRIGGEDEILLELPLGPQRDACCAVEQLLTLPSRGVRLRTRALTTTMFARYILGDLFVHGIGGAKYDELGDEISGRFFGFEPPRYLTASMTLRLGLKSDPGAARMLAGVEHTLRDIVWNPDRHAGWDASLERSLLEPKKAALAMPQGSHAERLARFNEIRRCNQSLYECVADLIPDFEDARRHLKAEVEIDHLARSREYSMVLHSTSRLKNAMGTAIRGLFDAS